jgi:hypothetical protein
MKEAEQAQAVQKPPEIITLKPTLWGMSIDLKAIARRIATRCKK